MIHRELVEQLIELEKKFPAIGNIEIRDHENTEYTVAGVEYDEDTGRAYIKFKECEAEC